MKVTDILHGIAEVIMLEESKSCYSSATVYALKVGAIGAYADLLERKAEIEVITTLRKSLSIYDTGCYISYLDSITIGGFKIYSRGKLLQDQFEMALKAFEYLEI